MAIVFDTPVTAGTVLVRSAIQSPDYVAGVSGWTVNIDGSAEFNDLDIRGTFNGTDYIINANGAFFYDSTPALFNLALSIAPQDGTDAFGNPYLGGGFCAYDNLGDTGLAGYVLLNNDAVSFGAYSAGSFQQITDAPSVNGNVTGMHLVSGIDPANPVTTAVQAFIAAVSGKAGQVTGSSTGPTVSITDDAGSSAVDLIVSGSVRASDVNGVPTAWQTIAAGNIVLGTGWASGPVSGGTTQPVQYRRDAFDNVVIVGTIHSTSSAPAAVMFTLAAGWRPKLQQLAPVITRVSPTATPNGCAVMPGGGVQLQTAVSVASTDVEFMITVPLGNIP